MTQDTTQARVVLRAMLGAVGFGVVIAAASPGATQHRREPPVPVPVRLKADFEVYEAETRAMARPLSAAERAEVRASGAEVERAFDRLHGAAVFNAGIVAQLGGVPEAARAFYAIHTDPNAAAVFAILARSGTAAGRLYGAIGLWHHDPKAFRVAYAKLRGAEHVRVVVVSGCIRRRGTVGELLNKGHHGIRLKRWQTHERWRAWRERLEWSGAQRDVVGGGFTAHLMSVKLH